MSLGGNGALSVGLSILVVLAWGPIVGSPALAASTPPAVASVDDPASKRPTDRATDAADPNGSIAGFVVEDNAGAGEAFTYPPVRGAVVELVELDRADQVDLYGFYEFRDVPPGTYTLRVSAHGYATVKREVTIVRNEDNTTNVFLTNRSARHHVRVDVRGLDTGIPLDDARVRVEGINGSAEGYAEIKPTDQSGHVGFQGLPSGAYNVTVAKDGYEGWSGVVTVGPSRIISVKLHGRDLHIEGVAKGRRAKICLGEPTPANVRQEIRDQIAENELRAYFKPIIDARPRNLFGGDSDVLCFGDDLAGRLLHEIDFSPDTDLWIRSQLGRTNAPPETLVYKNLTQGVVRVEGVLNNRTVVEPRTFELTANATLYRFDALPPIPGGRYEITVSAQGYETRTVNVSADPHLPSGSASSNLIARDVNLSPIPASINVSQVSPTYVDPDGNPMAVPGDVVLLEGTDNETGNITLLESLPAGTLSKGERPTKAETTVTFEGLPPGQYRVTLLGSTTYHLYGFGFPNRTVSVLVGSGDRREITVNRTPRFRSVGLTFNGMTSRYFSAGPRTTFKPLEDVRVRLNVPLTDAGGHNASLQSFPNHLKDRAIGVIGVGGIDIGRANPVVPRNQEVPYLVVLPEESDLPNTTDRAGTINYRLPPGAYAVEAIKVVEKSDSDLGFTYLYGQTFSNEIVRVGRHQASSRSFKLLPTWFQYDGEVISNVSRKRLDDAEVTFTGDGVSTEGKSEIGRVYPIQLPPWTHQYVPDQLGGITRDVTVNGRGGYSVKLPQDNYTVTVSADRHQTGSFRLNTAERDFADLVLEPKWNQIGRLYQCEEREDEDDDGKISEDEIHDVRVRGKLFSLSEQEWAALYGEAKYFSGTYRVYRWKKPPIEVQVVGDQKSYVNPNVVCPDQRQEGSYTIHFIGGTVWKSTENTTNSLQSPLEGATITIKDGSGNVLAEKTTTANGRIPLAEVDVRSVDELVIEVSKGGRYISETVTVDDPIGGLRSQLDVSLRPAQGRIKLNVFTPPRGLGATGDDRPLEGAKVSGGISVSGRISGETDERGKFLSDGLGTGSYEVVVSKPGYYDAEAGTYAHVETIEIPASNEVQNYSRSVDLVPIPDPNVTDVTVTRGPSTNEKGLFLQGVDVDAEVSAMIVSQVEFDDPPTDVAVVANPGEHDRERRLGDAHVEEVGDGRYRVTVSFNLKELPPGRNTIFLAVETEHGANTTASIRVNGSKYAIDILPTEAWLATTINHVAPAVTFRGKKKRTVSLPGATVNGTLGEYDLGPKVTVTVNDTGRYVSYGITGKLKAGMSRDLPVETFRSLGATEAGVDGAVYSALEVKFNGMKRRITSSGEAGFEANAAIKSDALKRAIGVTSGEINIKPSVKGSGAVSGHLTYSEPQGRSFESDIDFSETYTATAGVVVEVQIPLEAIPTVGAILKPLQELGLVDAYVVTRAENTVTAKLYFEEFYPMALTWLAPPGLRPDSGGKNTTVKIQPKLGVGLRASLLDGSVSGTGTITGRLTFVTKPEDLPPPYLSKIKGRIGAKFSASAPWPAQDVTKPETPPLVLAKGTLWERHSESTASITAESEWQDIPVTRNRYWDVPGYSTFAWAAGQTSGSLVETVFPRADPALASGGRDDAMVVYVRDSLDDRAETTLQYATWDGTDRSWTRPKAIPGSQFATAPATESLGDNGTVVIWRATGGLDPRVNPHLRMSETELAFAIHNGTGWSTPENLTDNGAFEHKPAVATDRGRALVVWSTSPSGYALDISGGDLEYAIRGGGSVGPATIVEDAAVVGTPALDFRKGQATVAYVSDADGNLSTKADRRVYVVRFDGTAWSDPEPITDAGRVSSPALRYLHNGVQVVWVTNGSEIRTAVKNGGDWSTTRVVHDQSGIRDLDLLGGPRGRVLAWTAFGNSSATLYYAPYNPDAGEFGQATRISDGLAYTYAARALTAANGSLLTVGLAKPNASDRVPPDLRFFETAVDARIDLGLPSASFTWSPTEPTVNESITFNASRSSDPDGEITRYAWDFDGDGEADAQGTTVSHTFTSAGDYTVTLIVTDDGGNSTSTTRTVTLRERRPVAFVVSDLAVPKGVRQGEHIRVSAIVSNAGTSAGNATVEFVDRAGAFDVEAKRVSLAAGESRVVTFRVHTVSVDPGTYTVGVGTGTDNRTGRLVVTPDTTKPEIQIKRPSPNHVHVTVSNVEPGTVTIDSLPKTDLGQRAGVEFLALRVTFDRHRNFTIDLRPKLGRPTRLPAPTNHVNGTNPFAYINVSTSLEEGDIDGVVFRFSISKLLLKHTGKRPQDIRLLRFVSDRWTSVTIERVDETDRAYIYEATSPGLSTFSVSTRGNDPSIAVTPNASSVSVGERTGVSITATYAGNGTPVEGASVSVTGPGVETTVRTDQHGRAVVSINPTREGEIRVRATKSGTNPGVDTLEAIRGVQIVYANITASPRVVDPGDPVEVSATVTNQGGLPGVFEARFIVDGQPRGIETGTLDPGASMTLSFEVRFERAGNHSVAINDRGGVRVTVNATPTTTSTPSSSTPATRTSTAGSPTATSSSGTVTGALTTGGASPIGTTQHSPTANESPTTTATETPGFDAVLGLFALLVFVLLTRRRR